VAAAYAAVLEHSYIHGPQAGLAQMLAASRELPLSARDAAAAGLALAATFPGARQPRLWLDTGLTGLEPGLMALLREGLGQMRPEPCAQAGEGWITAHGWAWEKLDLPDQPPPEGPAIMAPGDALVAPPGLPRDLAAARGVRVLDGMHPGLQRGEGPAQRALVERLLNA
jgi:hypothetical protein